MLIRPIFLCCIVLYSHAIKAQDTVYDTKPVVLKQINPEIRSAGVNYFFRKYDMEQGLENPYILKIRQNSKGELLCGTAGNGAGIFDGLKFRFMNVSNGLSHNVVQDVIEDNNGELWFATSGGGVCRFNGKEYIYYNVESGFPDNSVWAISQDRENKLWFGTEKNGVICYDGKTFKVYDKQQGLCGNFIREIFVDSNGNLWFGSEREGLSIFNGKTFTNYNESHGLKNNQVLGICEDKKGKIWIATYGGGLHYFSDGKITHVGSEYGSYNSLLCDVICDRNGNIWIASSGGGFYRFDGKQFTGFSVKNGLSNDVVLCLLEDKFGNIWAATYGGGICGYSAVQFTYFSEDDGLAGNIVRAIVQMPDSQLVFTTSGKGFSVYNGKEFSNYNDGKILPSPFVLCAVTGKDGKVWMGTSGGGILIRDGENVNCYQRLGGLSSNYFLSMCAGSGGEIYAGTYGGGLNVIYPDKIIRYGHKENLKANYINSISQNSLKEVMIGTETGLFMLKDGKIIRLHENIFNVNNPVSTVYFDRNDYMWAGSDGGGLYRIKNNIIENIARKDGLCNNNVKSVVCDEAGGVWTGTSNGIAYLKPGKDGKLSSYSIINFDRHNGFTGSNCMNNSIKIDYKGRVWIGTGRKLLCIEPEKITENKIPPAIMLDKINLFHEEANWKELSDSARVGFSHTEAWNGLPANLVLPYYLNHLTFVFRGININCPEKTKYSYILEGWDSNWSPVSGENKVVYSNLPEGKYTFKVKAVNESGVQSEEVNEYSFEIVPPWWKRTWFRVLLLFILVITIITIIKLRERKLVRDKKKLEAIVKERTAEVVRQRDEILIKNQILNQKNEEIAAQRDEIETQMEEISAQRDLVLAQKQQIELIHTELTDSIHYAKRIQSAILPQDFKIDKENFFILYKPKDIVSGDFYWFTEIGKSLVFCVADCTGHGVPGAFMSMLGISILNDIASSLSQEKGDVQASCLLNRLRSQIIKSLHQASPSARDNNDGLSKVRDGMDMALCVLNVDTLGLQFAGANNSLYIVRNNEKYNINNFGPDLQITVTEYTEKALVEIKGDKMPVGFHERMNEFSQSNVRLTKGDIIYIFSDGFADQFGGSDGKKLKYKQFKTLLSDFSHEPMARQSELLEKSFLEWKNELEQVDDVTVLGLKI